MKKWILLILVVLPMVVAQVPAPLEDNNVVLQKIDQEHKNTRKFVSDELTRQRDEFYGLFDERAAFYEKEFFDTLDTAVYKLSLLWGAIVFIIVGLSNMLRITLEAKRFRRMKETLKDELRAEIFLHKPPRAPETQQKPVYDQPHTGMSAYAVKPNPALQISSKDGWFARRKKRKLAKEIERIEKAQQKANTKAALLKAKMTNSPPPPPKPQDMAHRYNSSLMNQQMKDEMNKLKEHFNPDDPDPKVEVYY